MSTSVKKNFLFSSILTGANYFFPLLVYPYISRVLGVENIGLIGFIDSIINYFILFSSMGVAIIGIREIANSKNNPIQLSKTYCSLFTLTATSTIIMTIVLIIVTNVVNQLHDNATMMYIGAIKLIANLFLIEWFYKGMEDFKYITLRSIIIRSIYVVSVFIFVKTKDDTTTYFLLTSLSVVANAIINVVHIRKYISISIKGLCIKPLIKPFLILGLYSILTSMYTTFNTTYLGFACGDTEVGYYTTASKIYTILISIYTAFTGVLIPRMSQLVKDNKFDEFKTMMRKSCEILFAFSIPIICIIEILAPEFIYVISGPGYEKAFITMRIIMPLMLIIGYEQILIMEGLMPLKDDKSIFKNSLIGAIIGITLNILIVTTYASVGSAIVWVSSEISILIFSQIIIHKRLGFSFPINLLFKNFCVILVLIPMVYLYKIICTNSYLLVFISILSSCICMIIYQWLIIPSSYVSITTKQFILKHLQILRF